MKDIIKNHAGLCLELRDAWSGQVIEACRAQIRINGKAPDQQKDMRFFLFQTIEETDIQIVVQSVGFQSLHCTVSWEEYQEKRFAFQTGVSEFLQMPEGFWYQEAGIVLLSLWLLPGRDYVLPGGYAFRYVNGESEKEIRVLKNMYAPVFLMEDYTGGHELCMRAGEEAFGRVWRIGEPDGEYEDFTVTGIAGKTKVCIEPELCRTYVRGSRIYELFCTRADEEGNVMLIEKDAKIVG